MSRMSLALVFIIGLCFSSGVRALGFHDGFGLSRRHSRKHNSNGKEHDTETPRFPAPNLDIPPTVLTSDGLVAPLYRVNTRGSSTPHFAVELNVGNPPTPLNFTIDTMGRETTLPSEFCSNAGPAPVPYNPHFMYFIDGNNNNNGKGNGDHDKEKNASPPSPASSSDDKEKRNKASPPSPDDKDKGSNEASAPAPAPSGKGRDEKSHPQMSYIVPCNHKVCEGPAFTCDKMRKRCMGFDRMTGRPVDLVLTQITVPRVYATGDATGDSRTVRGLVMGCSGSDVALASLAPTATSLTSQLSSAASMPRKFAYCLGKPRGAFFVGGADHLFRQRDFKPAMQYLPMLTPPSEWQRGLGYRLALQGIGVGFGPNIKPLPIDPYLFDRGVVIGTRNRYTSLVDPAYQVVRKYFSKMASLANSSSVTPVASPFPELNLCYKIPQGAPVTGAPKVQFIFDNATLTVEPRNYIVRWRKTEIVCLGIVSAGPLGRISVIGTLQQEETLVEFDMDKNVVGVSELLTLSGTSCRDFSFLRNIAHSSSSSGVAPAPIQPHEDDSTIDDELEAAVSPSFDAEESDPTAEPPAY